MQYKKTSSKNNNIQQVRKYIAVGVFVINYYNYVTCENLNSGPETNPNNNLTHISSSNNYMQIDQRLEDSFNVLK